MGLTPEEKGFEETWESVSPMQNWYYRIDSRGDLVPHQVQGAKRFTIRTDERMVTQEKVVDTKHDPFTNGCFRPISVPRDINVDTNPNALSDDDIKHLFTASDVAWDEYLKVVDSPATLRRFLELAEGFDISLKRYRDIESRLNTVSPPRRVVQKDQDKYESMGAPAQMAGPKKSARA